MQVLQRPFWNGDPEELRELFVLSKSDARPSAVRPLVASVRMGTAAHREWLPGSQPSQPGLRRGPRRRRGMAAGHA